MNQSSIIIQLQTETNMIKSDIETHVNENQEKIEIFISCRKLKNMDILSLSDPQVRVYVERQGKWEKYGETEMIDDNLNPDFAKTIIMDYHFEIKQKLKFDVGDLDGPSKWNMIGSVETTLGELVGAKNQTSIFNIKHNRAINGNLILRIEPVRKCNDIVKFQIKGHELINVERGILSCFGCGKNNPFVSFYRSREDKAWVKVHETEIIKKTNNPCFKEIEINVQKLCNGDLYRTIKIECQSRSSLYKNKLIGQFEFNLKNIIDSGLNHQSSYILMNKHKKNAGTITFHDVVYTEKPTFLDYIYGGVQLNVIVGIDFTASNGDPSSPDSLHAIKYDGSLNEYQQAITSVCEILLNYDHDKLMPVYGFGAVLNFSNMRSTTVAHSFPVNRNIANPYVNGLQGIMQAYDECLRGIELNGPTLFTPLITDIMKVAQKNKENGSKEYSILLILTDGQIDDMENTINCIINSAKLPLSIIIIGIGTADFTNMKILDGDDGLINSQGIKAERDLVQFVPIRKHNGNREELAADVLAEIPTQFLEYMTSQGIKPNPHAFIDPNIISLADDAGIARTHTLNFGTELMISSDIGNINLQMSPSYAPLIS